MHAWVDWVLGMIPRAGAVLAAAGLAVFAVASSGAAAADPDIPSQGLYRQVIATDSDLRAVTEQIRVRTAAGAPQTEVAELVGQRSALMLRLSALLKALETMETQDARSEPPPGAKVPASFLGSPDGAQDRPGPPPGAKVPPSFLNPSAPGDATPESLLNPPNAKPPAEPPSGAKVPPSVLGPSPPLPPPSVLPASTSTWPPRRPVPSVPDAPPAVHAQPASPSVAVQNSAIQPAPSQTPSGPIARTPTAAASPEENAMQDAYAVYVDLVRRRAPAAQVRAAFVKYREAQMLVTARDPAPAPAVAEARPAATPSDRARPAAHVEERVPGLQHTVGRATSVAEDPGAGLHRAVGRAAADAVSEDASAGLTASKLHEHSSGMQDSAIDVSGYPESVRAALRSGGARMRPDGRVVMSETKNSAGDTVEAMVYDPATRSMSIANYNVASEPRVRERVAAGDLANSRNVLAGASREAEPAGKKVYVPPEAPDAGKCSFCDRPAVSTKPGATPCCREHYYKPQKMEGGTRERMRCEVCGQPGDWLQQWGGTLCDRHYRERDARGETAEAFGRQNLTCAWCNRPAMCFKPASGKPACDSHYMMREPVDSAQAGIACALCGKPAATIGQDRTGRCRECEDRLADFTTGGRGELTAVVRPSAAQGAAEMAPLSNPGSDMAQSLQGSLAAVDSGPPMNSDARPAVNAAAPLPRPVLGPGNLPPGVNGGHFPPPGRPGVATLRTLDGQTVEVPVDAEGRILGPVMIPQLGGAPPVSWPPGMAVAAGTADGVVGPDILNTLVGMEAAPASLAEDQIKIMSDAGTPSLASLGVKMEAEAEGRAASMLADGTLAWNERAMVENARNVIRESELRNERIKQDARAELQNTLAANARSRQTNTLASVLGDSVVGGLTTGVKNFGTTLGEHASDNVVKGLNLGKEEKPTTPSAAGTDGTSGGGTGGGWATSTPAGGKGSHGGNVAENCPDGHGGMAPAQGGGPVVTVEGYDMTCKKCGFKMRVVEGQPAPAACPKCGASGGAPPPTIGDGRFDAVCPKCGKMYGGPVADMAKGCPHCGGGGQGTMGVSYATSVECGKCHKYYMCKMCGGSGYSPRHQHLCPACSSGSAGDMTLIDAFCPKHRIKYGGLVKDNPKCPKCEAEAQSPGTQGLFDAFCPVHRIKYGGEIGKVKGCPLCLAQEAVKKTGGALEGTQKSGRPPIGDFSTLGNVPDKGP